VHGNVKSARRRLRHATRNRSSSIEVEIYMAGRPGGAAVAIAAWDATNRPGMGKLHRRLVTTVPAGSSSVQ
jgi:hypothetical protein